MYQNLHWHYFNSDHLFAVKCGIGGGKDRNEIPPISMTIEMTQLRPNA